MKLLVKFPFVWLIITGFVASIALVVEEGLPLSSDVHFLLQFLWLGVVAAALLAFAVLPVLSNPKPTVVQRDLPVQTAVPAQAVSEWYDEDRLWLQQHPNSTRTKE